MAVSSSNLTLEDTESSFFRALNAPFVPTPFPTTSEQKAAPRVPNPVVPEDHRPLAEPLFTAAGEWEWLNGKLVHGIRELETLHRDELHTTTLRTCTAGSRAFACINKSWKLDSRHPGVMSELWLYKHPLKVLQGRVVPKLIAVRVSPSRFNLAFELPHQTFLMEPSADMPDVLKRRIVEAVQKLHSKGVAHHALNLQDILIGADGQVCICNFHHARYVEEKRVVHLPKVKEGDFGMEMRRIKFKLDYQGARQKEQEWLRLEVERARAKELELAKWRKDKKYRPKKVLPRRTQVSAVFLREVEGWFTEIDRQPRRFVMPGQGEEDFEWELKRFHNILRLMEEQDRVAEVAQDPAPDESLLSPTRNSLPAQATLNEPCRDSTAPISGIKRKRSETSITSDVSQSKPLLHVHRSNIPEGFKHEEQRSCFKLISPFDIHTSVQENNLVSAWPMIVVRDFAKAPRLISGEGKIGKRLRQQRRESPKSIEPPGKRRKLNEHGTWTTWANSFFDPFCAFVAEVTGRITFDKRIAVKQIHRHCPSLGSPPRRLADILKHPAMEAISYPSNSSSTLIRSRNSSLVVKRPPPLSATPSAVPYHFLPPGLSLGVAAPLQSIGRVLDGLLRPLI